MSKYRFGKYIFNTHGLRLELAGRKHAIRPKTAFLLSVLIENRDRLVSKHELFQLVWNTDHVQDHTLFQMISEIRKLASDCELIRTQPNVGYQWIVKTEVCRINKAYFALATAASVACLYASVSLISPMSTQVNPSSQHNLQSSLPAMSAFSKGAIALEKGEFEKAEQWLRFSLAENPASIDTQLLLAESLLQQNKLSASESLAQSVMRGTENLAYSSSAAAELLSRIYQQQGSVYNALEYAIKGSEGLDAAQSLCTAEVFDLRIQTLSELIDEQGKIVVLSNDTHQITSQLDDYLLTNNATVPKAEQSQEPTGPDNSNQCQQLKDTLPDDELSDCSEPDSGSYPAHQLAAKENHLYFSGHS